MSYIRLWAFFVLTAPFFLQAQSYSVKDIPSALEEKSHAVFRTDKMEVELHDFDDMTVLSHSAVTILNKLGLRAMNTSVPYDDYLKIKDVEVFLYDKNGKEIKKFKKKDFQDVSASGGDLYNDNRELKLDFTLPPYPFTYEIKTHYRTTSTALLPQFLPIPFYYGSTQQSEYHLKNPKNISLEIKEYNLENFGVEKKETASGLSYKVGAIPAITDEYLSPYYTAFTPMVKIAPKRFELAGKEAQVHTWDDFASWQQSQLLNGRDELPPQTVQNISQLVAGVSDTREKVKAIYQYMQDRTRYISVQIGIGGWQPVAAKEVDELSYGDCKGLTNYTMALLKSQGIDSYYTIVNAGENGRDIDEDFVALQGNHVILSVPMEDEMLFLECTNQQVPFNYLGTHTDNRKALMITPQGGKIVSTHKYTTQENLRTLQAKLQLGSDLNLSGSVEEISEGLQYQYKYFLEKEKQDDIVRYYKETWSHLNNLTLDKIAFENDKDGVTFSEKLTVAFNNYTSKAGNRVLLNPNVFNRFTFIPEITGSRKQPIEVRRGMTYQNQIAIELPQDLTVASLFDPIETKSKFGEYTATIEVQDGTTLLYKRSLVLHSGTFPKEDYPEYVAFLREVVKNDKSKIVLSK
jgi:hypothetical protein